MKPFRILTVWLAALVLLWTARAAAQAASKPPDPARSIVVVCDLSSNATEDAKLRARLYEAARTRGLAPVIGADGAAAAIRAGVMTAGKITADETELERLRGALGVAVLGRVSTAFDSGTRVGVKVTVRSGQGAESRVIQAPVGAPGPPVEAVFAELLEIVGPPPPRSAPEPEPEPPPQQVVAGGLILDPENAPKEKSGGQVREEWEARGGVKPMFGAFLLATVQQRQNIAISDRNPMGAVETGEDDAIGIGGGVGARLALWYMTLPDPITTGGVFPAFRLGVGLDSNFLYVRQPTGFDYGGTNRETHFESRGYWLANVPLQAGFHLGLGSFRTRDTWRGAVLGIAYSPALQFELDMNQTEGEFRFNEFGVELTVDIAALDTSETSETQVRLMIFGLLPKDDDHPGMLTGGLGVAFY